MQSARIQLMDDTLINHIKAGEVIERPAAALKELLENSYDAGATEITVSMEKSGLHFLQVTDNGSGICQQDLALAVERHASSKLKILDDLNRITSMGFRGEALAAIAAISRFSVSSRTTEADIGYQIQVAGGQVYPIKPVAHPPGTTVSVAELFYNTPARRKFLRSERTEMLHVDTVIRRFALSAMSVAIKVVHNHKTIYHLLPVNTPEAMQQRLEKLLGKEFAQQAMAVNFSATHMHLSGWIGVPPTYSDFGLRREGVQYLYLNGRPIQDRNIQHAIKLAYASAGFDGRNCNYILYLELDPATVDVNVHPTKQEVRFAEKRLVHDLVTKGLLQAFMHTSEQEKIDVAVGSQTAVYGLNNTLTLRSSSSEACLSGIDSILNYAENLQGSDSASNAVACLGICEDSADGSLTHQESLRGCSGLRVEDLDDRARVEITASSASKGTEYIAHHLGKIICLLSSNLLILQRDETQHIVFFDLIAAQKFLMKLKINQYREAAHKEDRVLLLPVVIPIAKKLPKVVLEIFHTFGIFPEDFAQKKVILRNSPMYLQQVSAENFFNRLFQQHSIKKITESSAFEVISAIAVAALPKIDTNKRAETIVNACGAHSEEVLKKEKILQFFTLSDLMTTLGFTSKF